MTKLVTVLIRESKMQKGKNEISNYFNKELECNQGDRGDTHSKGRIGELYRKIYITEKGVTHPVIIKENQFSSIIDNLKKDGYKLKDINKFYK